MGANQLIHRMDALATLGEFILQLLALHNFFFRRKADLSFELGKRGREVRHHKMFRILWIESFASFIGQVGVVALFIDGKEKLLAQRARLFRVVLHHHVIIHLFQQAAVCRLLDQTSEIFILRHPLMHLIEAGHRLIGVLFLQSIQRLLHHASAQFVLAFHQITDRTIERAVLFIGRIGGRGRK